MIRDVAELCEHGQVERRVDELDVDVDTWRAGMRRAARHEGMRIRTFLVEPADPLTDPNVAATPRAEDWTSLGQIAAPRTWRPGTLVFAVRTDLPVDRDALAAAVNAMPTPVPPRLDPSTPTTVTEISDARARRSGHPCALNPDR